MDEATSYLMDVLKAEDKPVEIETLYNQELADQLGARHQQSGCGGNTIGSGSGF